MTNAFTQKPDTSWMKQMERNRHHQTTIDMVPVYKMAIALPRRAIVLAAAEIGRSMK